MTKLVAATISPCRRSDRSRGLTLENIGFGFGAGPLLFDRLGLRLEPGSLTAITGDSGAGKSTLAKIAAGLLAPRHGSVLLDGVPIGRWPREELRRRLLYVPQTSAVFTGTVSENVTLWDQAISPGDVIAALRQARADHMISARAGGLGTTLAHQSPGFSGGEIQRLALARALARRPDVLILDEITSALDALCEEDILAGCAAPARLF